MAEARLLSLYRYAARVVGYQCRSYSAQDVEDAFHEAMIKIWLLLGDPTHPHYLTAQTASAPWFATRAALLARSYLQILHRRHVPSLDAIMEDGRADGHAVDPTVQTAKAVQEHIESARFVELLICQVAERLPAQAAHLPQVIRLMVGGSTLTDAAALSGHHKSVISRQISKYLTPILRHMLADEVDDVGGSDEQQAEQVLIQLSFAFTFELEPRQTARPRRMAA